MRHTKIFASFFALSLLATACGHSSVGWKHEFDEGKDYALIAYDIYFISDFWPNYAIYLFPYDPETRTIDHTKRTKTGSGFVSFPSNEGVELYLGTISPGTYVVGQLYYQSKNNKSMICFPEKTIRADFYPGKITYIGEFTFTLDYPRVHNMPLEVIYHGSAHAGGRMAKYPMVNAEIVAPPITYTSFEPVEATRDLACMSDYID